MNNPIFISYYTKSTPYEVIIHTHLLNSLQKFGLKYDIEGIKNKGSWSANTHYKAQFIKKMLIKHKRPIIFVDADATIVRHPELFYKDFLKDYDISYHDLDWTLQWRNRPGDKREALSGTLYLNYTPIVLEFLDSWIRENNVSQIWEQKNMQKILEKYKSKLKIYPLPIEYIAIVRHNDKVPNHIKEPVIIHHQASRKHKK